MNHLLRRRWDTDSIIT